MKFNFEKWERLQRKKAELHQIYLSHSDDFNWQNNNFQRRVGMFLHDYRHENFFDALSNAIRTDARQLTVADISDKIERLTNDWPDVCHEYGLKPGFDNTSRIINLYLMMQDRRKAQDAMEAAAEKQQRFGQCFNTLNEYAQRFGQHDKSSIHVPSKQSEPDYGMGVI